MAMCAGVQAAQLTGLVEDWIQDFILDTGRRLQVSSPGLPPVQRRFQVAVRESLRVFLAAASFAHAEGSSLCGQRLACFSSCPCRHGGTPCWTLLWFM